MIKAIFFDVDGTLLSSKEGKIPQSALKALSLLKEQNILIFIASGRHKEELGYLPLEGIAFDGYVTLNGQLCLDQDKNTLFGSPMDEADKTILVELFNRNEVPLIIVEEQELYINFIDDEVRRIQNIIHCPIPKVSTYRQGPIYQACAYIDRSREPEIIGLFHHCKSARWNDSGIDIICSDSGKMRGIQKLLEHYQVQPSEIMAFGDAENDIDMLQYAQIGIAMGNAGREIKEIADYVTDSVDDDGIWNALRHFNLL
ncbi:MAG: Cof-type HAD-IIB family hydrolase [Lachnospiraceae bacterium]|nr:Cof-type HAD-IIB family hydrolase [Lachnospiraceae bacterium]